jgi:hypothetical protein
MLSFLIYQHDCIIEMQDFDMNMFKAVPSQSQLPPPQAEEPVEESPMLDETSHISPDPQPETAEEHIQCTWASLLILLDGSAMTRPDPKQELLEDLETWLREWDLLEVSASHWDLCWMQFNMWR